MKTIIVIISALVAMTGYTALHARGMMPPPPPFTGGNTGDWLGDGPIFGFDRGGGPGGGWGGGWYEGGGWGGWGFGSGGAGGYGGGGNGEGGGHEFSSGDEFGGLHGTCVIRTPAGESYRCACNIVYYEQLPPCGGCPVHGVCKMRETPQGAGCENIGDHCTGIWPR